jgi:hypothetical protein
MLPEKVPFLMPNKEVKSSHYRLGQDLRVPRRLGLPDFKTIGT